MSQFDAPDEPTVGTIDRRALFAVLAVILLAAILTAVVTGGLLNQSPDSVLTPGPTAAPTVPAAAAAPEGNIADQSATTVTESGHAVPDDLPLETISPGQAAERLAAGTALFVDMRESNAYTDGYIPGALGLFSDELQAKLAALPDNSVIIAYSDTSRPDAGRRGAAILVQLGYPRVLVLDGGLEAWRSAGLPVEKP